MTFRIPAALPEAFLLTAVVFGPLAFGATEPWSVALLEGLLYAAAVLSAGRGVANWNHPIYRTMLPATVLLLLLGVAQYFNPRLVSAPADLLPFTVNKEATGRALVLWGAYAALLFSAPQVFASRGAMRRAIWTVFILGAVIAVIGLMQGGQGNEAYYGLRAIRQGNPFGPYTNKNHAASVLVLAAFAGAGLWLSRLDGIRRMEQRGKQLEAWMLQALIAFFSAVILLAIWHIRSRGAIHAMIASSTIVAMAALGRVKSKTARRAGGLAVAAAVAACLGFVIRDPALIGLEKKASSARYRLDLYRSSLKIAKDFPLFGTGLASYKAVFPAYWTLNAPEGRMEHAHNDFLELLIESGAAALAACLAAVLGAFAFAVRAWFAATSTDARCFGGACLAAVLFFCLHSLVDFSFQIPGNAVMFLTLMACAASTAPRDGRPHEA